MDPLSRLPPECLQLIIGILVQDNRTATLGNLLQINKYLASVTLQHLYSNPFRQSFHLSDRRQYTIDQPPISVDRLARMLLARRAGAVELSNVVSVAFEAVDEDAEVEDHTEARVASSFDYMAHIRHLDVCNEGAYGPWQIKNLASTTLTYIQGEEFQLTHRFDRLLPSYVHRASYQGNRIPLLHRLFRVALLREIIWAIAEPILEQLRSLTIPVSDIKRYLSAIGRLKSLERVQFCLDELHDYSRDDIDDSTPEEVILAETRTGTKVETMRDLYFPDETQLEIFRMLPMLDRPRLLNWVNWVQFLAHLPSTDLGHVQEIDIAIPVGVERDRIIGPRDLLQRCRSLKRLTINALGQGLFKWAVEEKRITDRIGSSGVIDSRSNDRPLYVRHGLVPLEEVYVEESDVPFTDEINDIAFAFSQSLQKLTFIEQDRTPATPADLPERWVHVGQGWTDLPELKILAIEVQATRLVVDRDLLVHCSNAVRICLQDKVFMYSRDELVPCLPAQLPQLEVLELIGWSALTFHPDTLYSTARLAELVLKTRLGDDGQCFIPLTDDSTDGSLNSITPGVLWSWDWNLPLLTYLELNAAFAHDFQFRMLDGCPALESLDLDINATEGDIRLLDRWDLSINPWDDKEEENSGEAMDEEDEVVVAPSVRTLRMKGRWQMENGFLAGFLSALFPNLEELEAKHWIGVTIDDFLAYMRGDGFGGRSIKKLILDAGMSGEGGSGSGDWWSMDITDMGVLPGVIIQID
ncbi:hypothetical protein BGX23_006053 [Mortierella sp. AD031]|nr:hypothetical protein BGX23_006053 [Mortierella sp. AD031]